MRDRRRTQVIGRLPVPPPGPGRGADLAFHRADWPAYESLAAGLLELEEPRVLLVTGGDSRDHVRVATGVGTAAAVGGMRVLVMETDLARPALADLVGLVSVPGLREYLCWAADAPELLQPVSLEGIATEDSAPGQLVFITAGRAAVNGAALLAGESFPAALHKVRRAYQLVVLSSGPLPSPELTAVARHSDALLACIGSEHETKSGLQGVDTALAALPEQPAGVVICERAPAVPA